jgi:hypothetical protein
MRLLIPFLGLLLLSRCQCKPDSCAQSICTADFRSIAVHLTDTAGQAFTPDAVETWLEGKLLQRSTSGNWDSSYTIADDGHLTQLQLNVNRDVQVKVIKGGVTRMEQAYILFADCCHVSKKSGPDTLVVP